jgi:hypothetical protein
MPDGDAIANPAIPARLPPAACAKTGWQAQCDPAVQISNSDM